MGRHVRLAAAALSVSLLLTTGACVDEATTTDPDLIEFAGVWSGTIEYDAAPVYIALWLEQRDREVAGVIATSPVPFGENQEYTEGIGATWQDATCNVQMEIAEEGSVSVLFGGDVGLETQVRFTHFPDTETLLAVQSDDVDAAATEIVLERQAWVATRGGFDEAVQESYWAQLGCLSGTPPACDDGADNDGDGWIDLEDPGCLEWYGMSQGSVRLALDNDESTDAALGHCEDGLDNDGDGLTDQDDPECSCGFPGREGGRALACWDGWDNDGDGLADAADPDCDRAPDYCEERTPTCDDGVDNNGDGLVDGDDPRCPEPELDEAYGIPECSNLYDDDGDGLLDLDDPGCDGNPYASERVWECGDGLDNDGDGLIDLEDDEFCYEYFFFKEDGGTFGFSDCQDGIDNDGDGLVDRDNPWCVPVAAGFEAWEITEHFDWCANGIDDDGDGLTDGDDGGCHVSLLADTGSFWFSYESLPPCADGLDNDGDGLVDLADPRCTWAGAQDEAGSCRNGRDDDDDGLIDVDDPICAADPDRDEEVPQCQDLQDNDGDGLLDMDDPNCASPDDGFEIAACADGIDNDGDTLYDLIDPGCVDLHDSDESDE